MAIGIIADGRPQTFSFGTTSPSGKEPVTDATLFEIGSVSKTFTATVGAYAAATGRLDLEDHPSRFVPELAGTPIDKASLADLATYTAGGLPLQFPDDVDSGGMIDYYRGWAPSHEAGTTRVYSNPSIGLFGNIAARALGDDYPTIVETRMLPAFGSARPSSGSRRQRRIAMPGARRRAEPRSASIPARSTRKPTASRRR